jgi:hypothetical protein
MQRRRGGAVQRRGSRIRSWCRGLNKGTRR